MFSRWVVVLSAAALGCANAAATPDYRPAYVYAQRCFAVTSAYGDNDGARRAFDAAMKLGRLLNLSNRQLNADFDQWSSTEMVKAARDPQYKEQLLGECRKLGMAS